MRYLILSLLSALLLFQACQKQEKHVEVSYDLAIDSARSVLQELKNEFQVPGMAVAVSVKGEIVWIEGLGYSDMENRMEVDPAMTKFRIASISKSLTATAMAKLYEEGKLDPDKKIQEYVPSFPEKEFPISVRQVAGHIGGIRHYRGKEMFNKQHYESVLEGLNIFKDDPLEHEPGTRYLYSSYGWNLLSAVVENAAGESFLEFMDKTVIIPLDMKNTMAEDVTREIPNLSKFYTFDRDKGYVVESSFVDNSYKWAGGGYVSTVEDLVKFGNAYLGGEYLKPETIEEFTRPQMVNDTTTTNYGMGWNKRESEYGWWFGHSGSAIGGKGRLVIYPNDEIVVALLANSESINFGDSDHRIAGFFKTLKR